VYDGGEDTESALGQNSDASAIIVLDRFCSLARVAITEVEIGGGGRP
jgi:hypothetical protein